jgi:hypothetical protein
MERPPLNHGDDYREVWLRINMHQAVNVIADGSWVGG